MEWFTRALSVESYGSINSATKHGRHIDFMDSNGGCITEASFLQAQLLSDDRLQHNRLIFASLIKDFAAREKFLDREFDNRLKRHLSYKNFIFFVNRRQPLRRNNLLVFPCCIVTIIGERCPDQNGWYIWCYDPDLILWYGFKMLILSHYTVIASSEIDSMNVKYSVLMRVSPFH